MTPQQLVPDQQKCEALQEAGYPQKDSVFHYSELYKEDGARRFNVYSADFMIATPTVSEMVSFLFSRGYTCDCGIKEDKSYYCRLYQDTGAATTLNTFMVGCFHPHDSLANACTEACLWILKGEGK
jgi:hypothetical protein